MSGPSIRAQVAELLGEDIYREAEGHSPGKRLPVAQAIARCPRLGLVAAERDGAPVAVAVLEDGSVVVLPDNCPHDGGLISDGFVEGQRIVCSRHGWEFDGRSGQCSHRPELQVPCSVLAEGSGPVDS